MIKRPRLELQRRDSHDGSKSIPQRRGATGPRTELGKQRSKLNAIKYGIFSKVLLLGLESKEEFDALVSGLKIHYQPVGTLEETLVDYLATSLWRVRRVLTAEAAEIAQSMPAASFHDEDPTRKAVLRKMFNGGQGIASTAFLTRSISDLSTAMVIMKQLREAIKREGLSWARDRHELEEVFGRSEEPAAAATRSPNPQSLISQYREAAEGNYETDEEARQATESLVSTIDAFLKNKHEVCKRWLEQDDIDRFFQRDAALIPKPDEAEKLLRYQIALERSIERTMTQLERLQRMRLGQPVAPPIKVQIAG